MKHIAAMALLATAAVSASAQSSVTLFGVVDLGARNVKNGATSTKQLASNGLSTSRIGVRGTEDLGGGLTAGFWLEGAVNADNGTSDSTRFWGRRSTVSLSGGFGEVRLGRDFTPTYTAWSEYDAFGDVGVGAAGRFSTAAGSNVDTLTRADNQVSYILPGKLGGLNGQVSVAAGENTTGKKYTGGRIGYAAGPFSASLGYGRTEVNTVGGDDSFDTLAFGGSYDLGVAKLAAYYRQNKFAAQEAKAFGLGVTVPFGLTSLRASYTKLDVSGRVGTTSVAANDATQLAVGGVYNLSKRTALYGTLSRVTNKGASAIAISGATAAGTKSTGYEAGIRHAF